MLVNTNIAVHVSSQCMHLMLPKTTFDFNNILVNVGIYININALEVLFILSTC